MKKRFLSCLLLVLLCCVLLPMDAFAQQEYDLGMVTLGQPVRFQISTLPLGVGYSNDPLPPGCSLEAEVTPVGLTLLLSGTPNQLGSYSFRIYTGGVNEAVTCRMTVISSVASALPNASAVPTITTSSDVNCYVGDQVLLSVSASGGSAPFRYQWYSNTVFSNQGGAAVMNASSPELTIQATGAGMAYYYCVISDSMNQTVVSSPIQVHVGELSVIGIAINTMPMKTRYLPGEYLDPLGLTLVLTMSNGETRLLEAGYQVYPNQLTQSGQQQITVSYAGRSCTFPVTVLSEEELVAGIGMVSLPVRTEYKEGDILDPTGLVFRAWAQDGSYRDLSDGYTCEPMLLDRPGSQTITLSYAKKTCTFTVTVNAEQKLLEVASTPRKLSYMTGEALDTSGLVLKLGDQIIRSGFTCEPTVLTGLGTQVIKVRYNNQVATFTVSVKSAAASTPVPTVRPSSQPQVTASPAPSADTDSHTDRGGDTVGDRYQPQTSRTTHRTTLVVIMILAILCLIVLGAMMVMMNNGSVAVLRHMIRNLSRRFRR